MTNSESQARQSSITSGRPCVRLSTKIGKLGEAKLEHEWAKTPEEMRTEFMAQQAIRDLLKMRNGRSGASRRFRTGLADLMAMTATTCVNCSFDPEPCDSGPSQSRKRIFGVWCHGTVSSLSPGGKRTRPKKRTRSRTPPAHPSHPGWAAYCPNQPARSLAS